MESWEQIIERTEPCGHYVQFYKADEPLLNRNVGQYLWEGLLRGDGLLVIAAPERRESLAGHLTRMGADVALAVRERQLAMLDAQEMLARFTIDGQPDPDVFDVTLREALSLVQRRGPNSGVRAYGEMVGVLWQQRQYAAAIQLEEYWNKLLQASGITLFCGYPIDVFGEDIEDSNVKAVLCAHTHLLPAACDGDLGKAVHQAIDDVLGPKAQDLRFAMAADVPSSNSRTPSAEATILWLRKNVPDDAEGILSRARRYYDTFQECLVSA